MVFFHVILCVDQKNSEAYSLSDVIASGSIATLSNHRQPKRLDLNCLSWVEFLTFLDCGEQSYRVCPRLRKRTVPVWDGSLPIIPQSSDPFITLSHAPTVTSERRTRGVGRPRGSAEIKRNPESFKVGLVVVFRWVVDLSQSTSCHVLLKRLDPNCPNQLGCRTSRSCAEPGGHISLCR